MESEIISSENVKPSSPTPQSLRSFRVSLLDQIVPPILNPVVLFFPNDTNPDSSISQTLLKRSLSLILTRFYPLAGRLNQDGRTVDCNDQGVPFIVAKFTGHKLSDILKSPNLQSTSPWCFLPGKVSPSAVTSSVALEVQVNYFDCGGVAIGALLSHKLGDATTMATFLQSWASTARGSKHPVSPNYILQSIFPSQKQEIPFLFGFTADIQKFGRTVMRRYTFDASAISRLKSKSGVEGATRVEVVSALIWKHFMVASLANNNPESLAVHTVNLRRRAVPEFSSQCFGNLVWIAMSTSRNEHDKELGELVREVRGGISKVDSEFVNRMSGDGGVSGYVENVGAVRSEIREGVDALIFTSWCGLGFYDIDFGLGRPIWLTKCDAGNDSESGFATLVWLMDAGRNGDGIEAWVVLDQKYMSTFEDAHDLRALASIDPSPLDDI